MTEEIKKGKSTDNNNMRQHSEINQKYMIDGVPIM